MTILLISPEPWEAHFVSKHHYAQELARRGHDVLFHGPPETNGDMRLEEVGFRGDGRLRVLRAPRVAPGLRFLPARVRRTLEARWLRRVECLAGGRIGVVWLFENSRFYDMRFAGNRLKIYHQVDLNQDFHPDVAAETADQVFCTSELIRQRLLSYSAHVAVIHHGVQIADIAPETEAAMFATRTLNCLYVGNMSMPYLDRDLFLRCIQAYPHLSFHFVGGFRDGDSFRETLSALPNVYLHGKIPAGRVLSIAANADILMVAYQKAHFDDQSNPHKMMEYMMAGKVIVATYTMEYEGVSDLLAMCGRDDDYVALMGEVAGNIDAWNTPDLIARRRAFAADNSYPRQLDRIAAALGPQAALIS